MKNVKIPPQIVAYALISIIVLWIVYQLMKKVGLISDQVTRKKDKTIAANVQSIEQIPFWNPSLYQNSNYGYAVLMPNDTIKSWAKDIHDSFGWFNDDEEQVYNVFRKLTNQIILSQLSDAYSKLYSSDLLGDLKNYFDDKELSYLYTIISNKPIGGY